MGDYTTVLVAAIVVLLVVVIAYLVWPRSSGGHSGGSHKKTSAKSAGAGAKSKFHPVPVSPCGPPYGGGNGYGTDITGRNASGTTVWPNSSLSHIAPDSSGVAESFVGGHRGARQLAFDGMASIESDEPSASRPYGNNSATIVTGLSRAHAMGNLGGTLSPLAFAAGDVDTDFDPGSDYTAEALKESLTSERHESKNTLIASKTGLGSVRIDPRFEPGPQAMLPGAGGSAVYADGAAAGGPSTGALTPSAFGASPTMISGHVFGFGSDEPWAQPPPEAVVTGASRW